MQHNVSLDCNLTSRACWKSPNCWAIGKSKTWLGRSIKSADCSTYVWTKRTSKSPTWKCSLGNWIEWSKSASWRTTNWKSKKWISTSVRNEQTDWQSKRRKGKTLVHLGCLRERFFGHKFRESGAFFKAEFSKRGKASDFCRLIKMLITHNI